MSEVMQPGDYIAREDIQGPNHLELIREGVREMGYAIRDDCGQWGFIPSDLLLLDIQGDLTWSMDVTGRRWTPDEVIGWAERQEYPPQSEEQVQVDIRPKRQTEAAAWLDEFATCIDRGDERWWEDYEFRSDITGNWKKCEYPALLMNVIDGSPIRRAARYVTLGGVTFKAPETEAPEYGTNYYSPDHDAALNCRIMVWYNTKKDRDRLGRNRVHLDRENAAKHAQAEREAVQQQMGGGSDEP